MKLWSQVFGLPADIVRTLVKSAEDVTGDYGWAIVLVALGLRLVLLPLTIAQRRGSVLLRELRPELEQLRREHAGDPGAFGRAQMALLRERHFNPWAGCLATIAFVVLGSGFIFGLAGMPELKGVAPFGGRTWIDDLSRPDRLFAFGRRVPLLGSDFHLLPWLLPLLTVASLAVPRIRRGLVQGPLMTVLGLAAVCLLLYHLPAALWLALIPYFAVNFVEYLLIPLPPLPGDEQAGRPTSEPAEATGRQDQ
jgi:membrane protein insertase Oxa1/YidC/SpoIIIJ